MKFYSIRLRDFQCHEDLEVRFSPGITSVVGPSDSGKSAILRALRWVCLNDFAGDDFVREGAKRSEVTLTVRSGQNEHVIQRIKGGSSNLYILDGKEFRSFGQSVPDEIRNLLRLSPVNFQGQHDAPYWFSETAGEVSRRINAISNLSLMDQALSFAAEQVRSRSQRQQWVEQRLQSVQKELEESQKHLPRIEEFQRIRKQWERLQKKKQQRDRLVQLLQDWKSKTEVLEREKSRLDELGRIFSKLDPLEKKLEHLNQLKRILSEIVRLERQIRPLPSIDPLDRKYQKWVQARDRLEEIRSLVQRIRTFEKQLSELEQEVSRQEERFHRMVSGKICPVCGQKIP